MLLENRVSRGLPVYNIELEKTNFGRHTLIFKHQDIFQSSFLSYIGENKNAPPEKISSRCEKYVLPISLFTLCEVPLPELLDPIEQVILAIFLSKTLCFSEKKS